MLMGVKMDNIRIRLLGMRLKHLRGRHDQRDHNRWPAGYQAQTYTPTGRRGSAMAARVTGGLAGVTQSNVLANADLSVIQAGINTGYTIDEARKFIDALNNVTLEGFPLTQSTLDVAREEAKTSTGQITLPPRGKVIKTLTQVSGLLQKMKDSVKNPSTINKESKEPSVAGVVEDDAMMSSLITNFFNSNPEASKMFAELDKDFGITTWSLPEETELKSIAENAEKAISEMDELKKQILEEIVEVESLSIEIPVFQAIYTSIQEAYNKLDRKIELLSMSPTGFLSEEEKEEQDKFIQDSIKIKEELSFYLTSTVSIMQYMRDKINDSLQRYNALLFKYTSIESSSGQKTVLPEIVEFLKTHFGKAVNPNMEESLPWSPNISSQSEVDETVIDSVNEVLQSIIDGRLVNGIGEGDSVNPQNGPRLEVLPDTSAQQGLYYVFDNKIEVSESSYTAPVLLHEYIHSVSDQGLGVPGAWEAASRGRSYTPLEIRRQLNSLVLGFLQHRYSQNPGVKRKDTVQYIPDDFPDWYAGFIDFQNVKLTGNVAPEVLTVGINFLLQNPVKFAKEQPDYFRFISVLLSGAWIK